MTTTTNNTISFLKQRPIYIGVLSVVAVIVLGSILAFSTGFTTPHLAKADDVGGGDLGGVDLTGGDSLGDSLGGDLGGDLGTGIDDLGGTGASDPASIDPVEQTPIANAGGDTPIDTITSPGDTITPDAPVEEDPTPVDTVTSPVESDGGEDITPTTTDTPVDDAPPVDTATTPVESNGGDCCGTLPPDTTVDTPPDTGTTPVESNGGDCCGTTPTDTATTPVESNGGDCCGTTPPDTGTTPVESNGGDCCTVTDTPPTTTDTPPTTVDTPPVVTTTPPCTSDCSTTPPPPGCTVNCTPPPPTCAPGQTGTPPNCVTPCTSNCSVTPPPCTQNCTPPCTTNCSVTPPPCTSDCTTTPPCTINCSTTTPPCTINCSTGGGGGGGGGSSGSIIYSGSSGQILAQAAPASYVYLSQIPYTGLDLGPIGTVVYWTLLVLFCLAAAYLIIFSLIPFLYRHIHGFGTNVGTILNQPAGTLAVAGVAGAGAHGVASHAVPAHAEPSHAPVGHVVHSSTTTTTKTSNPSAYTAAQGFRSFAQGKELTIDDIVNGLARLPETASAPSNHFEEATVASYSTYPEAQVAPAQTFYSAEEVIASHPIQPAHYSAPARQEAPAAAISTDVRDFCAALLNGDRDTVFGTMRQIVREGGDAETFLTQVVVVLDDAYRARMDGTKVNPEIARLTQNCATPFLERLTSALTNAVDSSYTPGISGSKLALTRALAVVEG
jgi:hypothetical protein